MTRRRESEELEQLADHKPGENHRDVRGDQEVEAHARAVVLPVDVEDGDDDQVGEDEADHATEADAAVPQHDRKRDVADGADEAEQRDDRRDDRIPEGAQPRLTGQEQSLPEAVRNPCGQRAGDEKPEKQILPQAVDIPIEVMADGGEGAWGKQAAEEWAVGDGHVHLSMTFHPASEALFGLLPGERHHARAKGVFEYDRQNPDHQQPAGEFGGNELPAEQDDQDDAQLEDEVGAGKLEENGVGQARATAEQSA